VARAPGRPSLLPPGWIVFAFFTLNPVWWLLGFGGFTFSIAALPLGVWAISHKGLQRPPAIGLYAVYVVWAGISVIRLDKFTRLLSFGMRYGAYISALCLAYYVYNERRVTRETFIRWMSWFWVAAIVGGYVGMLVPHGRLSHTLASAVLPHSISDDEFVGNLVRPTFAQVQNIFGVAVPRPNVLFTFTNEWGGNVGLLLPFFVASTLYSTDPKRRRFGVIMLLVSVPPMIVSLNRGLWISVILIFALIAVRSFLVGRTAPLKMLAGAFFLAAVLFVATPLGGLVVGRLSESDTTARAGIYSEAWQGALDSPILGWGGPRPSINPYSPAIGTHGHFWFAMFSHGLVGLGIYVAWVIDSMAKALKPRDPVSMMLACVVFVGGVQMFFYKLLPVSLPIICVALGLMFRTDSPSAEPTDAIDLRQRAQLRG
jgi:polysaccharide biosynthesis protein PslJ